MPADGDLEASFHSRFIEACEATMKAKDEGNVEKCANTATHKGMRVGHQSARIVSLPCILISNMVIRVS